MSTKRVVRYVAVWAALTAGFVSGAASGQEQEKDGHWRLNEALRSPEWFNVSGTYRVRYETLNHPFRAEASGSDEILVERLFLNASVIVQQFHATIELEDSRQQLADSGTPLGTDIVNAVEPVQAYVGMSFDGALSQQDQLDLTLGRMTIDAGSRRLVARNSFRNTTNAFAGARATWKGSDGQEVFALYAFPVQRKPTDFESLKNNDIELDRTTGDITFWGLFGSLPGVLGKMTVEAYAYGYRTRDSTDNPIADRNIYTPGFRLYRKPAKESWDFEVETAYQWGTSRLGTAATDTTDLQHSAGFFHGEIGYTLKAKMSPRLELSYDYASGDKDPDDNRNNRFDTLFGARRFDFGPTGIYGPFARANINSPGARLELKPARELSAMVGYRAVWLASDRDQFTTARLQDPTGNSGSFIGHQIEAQLQYDVLPGNVALEIGGAYLFQGEFLEKAPGAPDEGNTTYLYVAATLTF